MVSRRINLQSLRVSENTTNASLWLDKFIVSQDDEIVRHSEKQAKQTLVDEVAQIKVTNIYERFFYDIWLKSIERTRKKLIQIDGRMVIGLGAEGVLETSITLHRTYGIPYIPGSALKGLAASYAHRWLNDDWNKETKKTQIGEAHKLMFGSQNSAGYVIFHDSLYVPGSYGQKPLATDILTVHHQDYYKDGRVAPADWDSPVPVPFLSAQGSYLLAVSANSGDEIFDGKMTKLAIDILELGLRDEGIGAKTSSGYGRATLKDFDASSGFSATEDMGGIATLVPEETHELTEEEKQKQQKTADERRLEGIKKELEAIGDFEKQNKDKLKDIRKRLKKIDDPMLKKDGAELFAAKFKQVSKKTDEEFSKIEWFEEIKIMLKG